MPGTHQLDYRMLAGPELRVPPPGTVFGLKVGAESAITFRTGVRHLSDSHPVGADAERAG